MISQIKKNKSLKALFFTLIVLILLAACAGVALKSDDKVWWNEATALREADYKEVETRSLLITTRDGVRLAADLYLPEDLPAGAKLPTILVQTRYVRDMNYRWPFSLFMKSRFDGIIRYFVQRGYAWVFVDARGSGASFGTRPYPYSDAEILDGVDVVDWIVDQSWSDGKVGSWGSSYTGGTALFLASNKHPAVKAIMPRYAMFDTFSEVIFPGGIHLQWMTDTWSRLAAALDKNAIHEFMGDVIKLAVFGTKPVDIDKDGELLAAAVADHRRNGNIGRLVEGIEYRDDASRLMPGVKMDQLSVHTRMKAINESGVAMYFKTGWLDAALSLSEVHLFLNANPDQAKLTIGPWDHGGYHMISPHAKKNKPLFDVKAESLRFFDRHLKGVDNGFDKEPRVHYYTMGEEKWKTSDSWPPPNTTRKPFYFGPDNALALEAPSEEAASDSYLADYSAGTGLTSRWVSLVNIRHKPIGYPDRKKADKKLLCYTGAPLEEDLEVTGHPLVTLYLTSTASDGNFFVYLEDVWPGGRVDYISEGMLRGIHRKISQEKAPYRTPVPYRSYLREDASPLTPGRVAELTFDLYPISYLFKKGHRIRVAIAAADKDHFSHNPKDPPRLEIQRSSVHPSHVLLPIFFKQHPILTSKAVPNTMQ